MDIVDADSLDLSGLATGLKPGNSWPQKKTTEKSISSTKRFNHWVISSAINHWLGLQSD
jgi:hypothetical protein